MDFKDFIIGEKYNISALAIEGSFAGEKYAVFKLPTGRTFLLRAEDFEAVSPARQDERSEHSTVGTLNSVERLEKLWNGVGDVLFGDGTKNTETAPKYDPTRKFRKGDIVEPCKVKGRWLYGEWETLRGVRFIVMSDEEDDDGLIIVQRDDSKRFKIVEAVFFQLVTPVEELEPYIVVDAHTHWDVADKNMKTVAMYSKGNHPNAKEAAEAERDRLNAEHRKEQCND